MGHGFVVEGSPTDVGFACAHDGQDVRMFQVGERVYLLLEEVGVDVGVIKKTVRQHIALDRLEGNGCFAQAVVDHIYIAEGAAAQRVQNLVAAQVLPF